MPRLAKQFKPLNMGAAALMLMVAAGGLLWRNCQMPPRQLTAQRPPGSEAFVFDYAGILAHPVRKLDPSLEDLRENHSIETVIVTFTKQPEELSLERLARKLMEDWQIGGSLEGRGILLLVAAQSRRIQVSVGSGLKQIYTDDFCRRIQNWQWPALFEEGRMVEALAGVVAEILNRARLTQAGDFTPADIQHYDRQIPAGPKLN